MNSILNFFRSRTSTQQYSRLATTSITYRRPKRIWNLLKWGTLLGVFILIIFFIVCDLQLTVRVYLRNWISHADDAYYQQLGKCFQSLPDDSPYILGNNNYIHDVTPGVGLLDSFDCYDFASTIQPTTSSDTDVNSTVIYHAYWRADIAPPGPKQLATLRSFFATQNVNNSMIYLWSNGDLSTFPVIQKIKSYVGDKLITLRYDSNELSRGTPMESSPHLDFKDNSGYLDGDLVRLLVLYKYGGMWFDMDSLFVRDMSPLFEREWLQQWDCFLPPLYPFNGAFMRFNKHSPYLCEILDELANGPLPRPNSIDWGGYTYYKVYRRLLHNGIRPWSVLPWCFTDSMVCTTKNSMPNAFVQTEFPEHRLLQTFAYHWHNQWNKEPQPGSLFSFLEDRHKNVTGW